MPAPQVVQLVDAPGAQIDAELLEIFLEEATEVVETIAANVAVCRGARTDREALTTIRRGFHTLKGSGRMVGLDDLGEMAWQCEQVMNKWLKEEKPATDRLLDFVELARAAFAEWVGELKEGRAVTVDASHVVRRAEALKGDEPIEAVAAVQAAPAEFAPVEAAPVAHAPVEVAAIEPAPVEAAAFEAAPVEAASAEPAPGETSLEPLAFEESLEPPMADAREESGERADAAALASLEFTFESLDLAPAPEAAPHPAATESLDFGGLFDAPAAPATPALPESTAEASEALAEPAAGQFDLNFTREPAADAAAAEATPVEDEEIIVGGVSVPTALFAIYMGEAEEHAAAMDREMSALEADPMVPVSAAFMRAAHTLASSSRTTGFESIAAVSAALEKWLADAMEFPPEFDAHRLGVTRNAVDALMAMVQSVRGNAMPYPREDVIESLGGLRESLRRARETGQGTHINMPGFVRAALDAAAQIEHPAHEHAEPMQALEAPVEAAPVEESFAEPLDEAPAEPTTLAAAQPDEQKPFESGKDQRRIVDDVDRDLLPIFLDEAKEIIPLVSEGVRRWRAAPADHAPARDLQRHLHTLKGSARMTGLMRLGELAHVLETRVNAIDGAESPPARAFEEIEERVDRFSVSLERLARGEDIVEAEPVQVPVSAVFEQQKDKPGAIAVMAAAAQEVAQRDALP
ncbi:MAG TPA: Hpt domain-containing protein, partial [Usitatibacter sp.]|nr:Hpt domain-containing protein [Usitatibacter sp.]